jgi:acyl-coenzyme A synthetase/AMP-(fatty) acid ligase
MADAEAYCEPEAMDAEDPLFILYTSARQPSQEFTHHAGYLLVLL